MIRSLMWIALLLADPAPPDLHGVVSGPDDQPITLASVMVYSAVPKNGPQLREQLDYPDCGKSVLSSEKGAFAIPSVDPSLNYELLVLADGFRPTALRRVDPAGGEIRAKLSVLPKNQEPDHLVRGRVVDADGKAVVGAWIQTHGYSSGNQRFWGGGEVVEKETWTDAKGEFTLVCQKTDLLVYVEVHDRTIAPVVCSIAEGADPVEIPAGAGATISGRLVKGGQPVPGVRLQLAQMDRAYERWIGEFTAITDEQGRFTYKHVSPGDNYHLWAVMKTLGDIGAIAVQQIASTAENTVVDAGEIQVEDGFIVAGQLVCPDDKPVPAGAKILLSRNEVGDPIEAKVNADGTFEFKHIAGEAYRCTAVVDGYRLSRENQSVTHMSDELVGLVDQDITDLRVKLDPGRSERVIIFNNQRQDRRGQRLAGVAPP